MTFEQMMEKQQREFAELMLQAAELAARMRRQT